VSGWLTLGWFAFNPTYAARPDNTGLALLRYGVHTELSVWTDHLSVGLYGTMFTDRRATNPVAPSELDFTAEITVAFRRSRFISRTSGTCPSIEAVWSGSSSTPCSCTNSISYTTTPVHSRTVDKSCRRDAITEHRLSLDSAPPSRSVGISRVFERVFGGLRARDSGAIPAREVPESAPEFASICRRTSGGSAKSRLRARDL